MTPRLAAALIALCLLLPAGAAAQQSPFGPLPPPAPEPTPQPTVDPLLSDEGDVSRTMLFVVGGSLLVVFAAIGWVITRDARSSLPSDRRAPDAPRDQGPHRHERKAKAKARAKGREQRRARKTTRKRSR